MNGPYTDTTWNCGGPGIFYPFIYVDGDIVSDYISRSTVKSFLHKHGGDWTVVDDPKGSIALDWGVRGLPESYLVDPRGVVRLHPEVLDAIARVHRAWCVHDTDAVLSRQSRSRMHESGVTDGQGNSDASTDQPAFTRLQLEAFPAAQISSGVARIRIRRRLKARIELPEQHFDSGHGLDHSVSVDEAARRCAAASCCGRRLETNQYGIGSSWSLSVISTAVLTYGRRTR